MPASDTFRTRVLSRELLAGSFLNLGSSVVTEMAGLSGLDWVLIDQEHGVGGEETLLHQLQAVKGTPALPIVRVAWNDAARFKRVLDLGAAGIMVPWIADARDASKAVEAMRYPPHGIRGVSRLTRASSYGADFEGYFSGAKEELLTVIQIETESALSSVDEIAAIDGVDVLFVGPLDLTIAMGIRQQFDHPRFLGACDKVAEAARNAGKAAGILLYGTEQLEDMTARGFTFVAVGTDGGIVANGMKAIAKAFETYR